jgi:diguanylate cyclase (GGDEF)-like protein
MEMKRQNLAVALIGVLAALHLAVCAIFHSALLSGVIQLVAALLATGLCLKRTRESGDHYFRWLWSGLGTAFFLWAAGQTYAVWYSIWHTGSLSYPNPADFFWLLYSFPILLLASKAPDHADGDWTGRLDLVQACISAFLLYSIVLLIPGVDIVERAYDIQGVALLFACGIRFSTAGSSEERCFFRNLTIYVVAYDLLGLVTQIVPQNMVVDGAVTDLTFSFPFLIFCAVSIRLPETVPVVLPWKMPRTILPCHIHGISCLGLALTSIASGVVLTIHHTRFGIPGMIVSCGVFALRTATRESQLKCVQLQLEYDNHHDNLTGLANRAFLIRELEQPNTPSSGNRSLLYLDLDRFKMINDSLGHVFGDHLLIHVANLLRSVVRPGDVVARLGGDEFVVLLNNCPDGVTAEAIAERILTRLCSPVMLEGKVIQASGSIGIAALQEGESSMHLLRNADAAMYAAKSLGTNRVRIFDRTILDKAARQLEMETDLRHSVENGSITVNYQPVYSLKTGTVEGFEALARWTHPQYGAIPPDEFIPRAEDAGLIVELGNQVISKACRQVAAWNRQFRSSLTVSINVSAWQLASKEFLPYVREVLLDSRLEASRLKFEITESVLMNDRQPALETLCAARAMDIEIYLDDFGTGYSALDYLLEFPFDAIKIDKRFLLDFENDERHATVMATIVQLAKGLRKRVVAAGIENLAQLEFITSIHCDYGQGYLFSKPLRPDEMTRMLSSEMTDDAGPFPSFSHLLPNLPARCQGLTN